MKKHPVLSNNAERTKQIAVTALLAALAFAATAIPFFKIPVVPAAPYLKFDPKDVFIVLGGFIVGPLASVFISVSVSVIEMFTLSSTGLIGLAMNVIASCAFAVPAAYIYKKRRDLAGAVIGLAAGSLFTCAVMLLWNWLMVPLYTPGLTRAATAKMLIPVFLPFNVFKTAVNSCLTLLLYRPVIAAFRRAGLVKGSSGGKKRLVVPLLVAVAAVLALCAALWFLLNR